MSSLDEVGGWVCRKGAGVVWGKVILCFLGLYLGEVCCGVGGGRNMGVNGCMSGKIIKEIEGVIGGEKREVGGEMREVREKCKRGWFARVQR